MRRVWWNARRRAGGGRGKGGGEGGMGGEGGRGGTGGGGEDRGLQLQKIIALHCGFVVRTY